MKRFLASIFFAALFLAIAPNNALLRAQTTESQAIEFTKKVHNFGKISVNDGEQKCSFEFRNTSGKPVVINNIISSCGCTTPVWPKKPIMPGESGKVEVTYLNDQGPYPFDKALTVYTSSSPKPIVLRITGLAYENERSMKEMFPVAIGPLGVKDNMQRGGQIRQGNEKGGSFKIANISNKSVSVKFADISEGLQLEIQPATIPAGEVADVSWKISTAGGSNWGNTTYSASVLCNGAKASKQLGIECMIIDNFSKLTKEEMNKASMVIAQNSSFNFGDVRKGESVTAIFNLRNTGYSPLVIHKIESEGNVSVKAPSTVAAGEKFTIEAKADTSGCSGEAIFTITLVTNSPNRPLVNLFITGNIR